MISHVVARFLKPHKNLRYLSLPIALQIAAVNDLNVPKNSFLFDYGTVDVEVLKNILNELKLQKLICHDVKIVTLELEIFIVNVKKIIAGCILSINLNIIDVGKNLEMPKIIHKYNKIAEIFDEIVEKLKCNAEIIELGSYGSICPTLYGFLINYPVLYFCDTEENCLSDVELKVFQIKTSNHVLISFSVPLEIYYKNTKIQENIKCYLDKFTSNDYSIKTFNTTECNVVL